MAVEKFSISLPRDLTEELDDLARARGVTRSALIREAAAEYVTSRESAARETERKRRVARSLAGFDAIAASWGAEERSAAELLAEIRGETGGDSGDGRER